MDEKKAARNTNELKSVIASVAREHGVEKAYLFGSYARGEAGPDSDVDICIQKGAVRSLIGLSGLYLDLEEKLGKKIDLVTTDGINGDLKEIIEKDFVEIYDVE